MYRYILFAISIAFLFYIIIYTGKNIEGYSSGIPKKIWTYWNSDDIPDVVVRCIATWKKHNPDFMVTVLTPTNLNKYIEEDIKSIKWNDSPARESDIVRLLIIEKYGGYWCDSTIIMTAPLNYHLTSQTFVGYYIGGFTTKPEYPVLESWFFGSEPRNPFVTKWKNAFFKLGDFKNVSDAVSYMKKEGVNIQNIDIPEYLFIHVAAQYVFQKQMTPDEIKKYLFLQKAEDGPYKYLSNNNWSSHNALNDLCDGNNITPLIKFRGGERGILIDNPELANCIFSKVG
jgi:hypothetical protein